MGRMETDEGQMEQAAELTALEADRAAYQRGDLSASEQELMFSSLADMTADARPSLMESVCELGTPMRVLIAAFAMIGAAALGLVVGVRPDLTSADVTLQVVMNTSLLGLAAITCVVALRGYHTRSLGRVAWLVIGLALGAPAALALAPELWATGAPALAPSAGRCLTFGSITGAIAASAVWLLQRGGRPAAWRMSAATASGGLTAFVALQIHCPSREVVHSLGAHAGAGVLLTAWVLVYAAARPEPRQDPE